MQCMESSSYTIGELAKKTGVSPRTVRYYIRQGLLPSPGAYGPGAHYGQAHLDRLRLIKDLQRNHLPLSEIRRRLEPLSDAEMRALIEEPPPAVAESAVDYVRTALAEERLSAPPALRARSLSPAYRTPRDRGPDRSQWEHFALMPDVELHVRRPLGYWENGIVNRILESAREILEEEKR